MKKLLPLIMFCLFFSFLPSVNAENNKINIDVFTQTGCQYCAQTMDHLNALKKDKYPEMVITEFDIRRDPTFYQSFIDYKHAYGSDADGTPVTFIGKKVIQGALLEEIDAAIEGCKQQSCEKPADIVATYVKEHPSAEQQKASDKTIIGLVIIGVVVVGGGILLLSRN